MRLPCLAVIALTVIASHAGAADSATTIIPGDWLPALSPSITSALQQLKDAESQSEMNLLSRQIADMTDAQLFIAYVRLYEKLSAKERAKLVEEQASWLKERPKVAKKGIQSEGGSLAPLESNNAELTYTEKRLRELRARLKAIGDDTTPEKATAADEEKPAKKRRKRSADDAPSAKAKKKTQTDDDE